MNEMLTYIESLNNENTRKALRLIFTKLNDYSVSLNKKMESLNSEEIEQFIVKEYSGKSETTIANAITSVKRLYKAIGRVDFLKEMTFLTMKEKVSSKENKVFTPKEMKEFVDVLLNAQDKALVILTYLGLYDENFNTIRHLKESDITETCIYANNKEVPINAYIYNILKEAMEETVNDKYGAFGECIALRPRNGYLIRGQESFKSSSLIVSAIMLKKRFKAFADYLEEPDFTPICIKNSKVVYDLAKLEYDVSGGLDINQIVLVNYAKDTDKKGCIERLNILKKNLKQEIFKEIYNKENILCP